jgi:predicted nucleic acid-binding protein
VARYTLDTNVLIDALNQPALLEDLLEFLGWALPETHLSAVVAHEVDAGTTTARQRGLLDRQLVGPFERRGRVFAPSVAAWRRAGQLIAQGHRARSAAGLNDLLLAISCREAGMTLVTRDRDFRRLARLIRGLSVVAPFPVKASPGVS